MPPTFSAQLRNYFLGSMLFGGGGWAPGDITNVNQLFQPSGLREAPNSK